jgi:hypothetical protein
MKPILIIAIVVVLLIPLTSFAQESQSCPPGSYHGLDNSGNDACRDIETNKVVKTLTKYPTSSSSSDENPLSMLFKFIENLFKGLPVDVIEKSVDVIEKSVESVSDSIPIDLESLSGNSEGGLEDCSKYKNSIRDGTDMEEAFRALQKTKQCESNNMSAVKQGSSQGTILTQHTDGIFLKHEYCHKSQTSKCQSSKPFKSHEYSFEGKSLSKFSLGHIGVVEKDNSKIIILDIRIEPFSTNNKSESWGGMYVPSSMGLKNEHGTKYVYLPATCKTPKPWMSLPNTGATIAHCYRVEKNIDKFDVIYEKLDEHRKLKQTVIGTFLLN